jgi:hypothetical protein
MNCGEKGKWKHHAPRNPELIGDFYCPPCFIDEAEEVAVELQEEIEEARAMLGDD